MTEDWPLRQEFGECPVISPVAYYGRPPIIYVVYSYDGLDKAVSSD
jgi:hypothetical protein